MENTINIENFWNASIGIWDKIEEIPQGFEEFANSGNSTYYTNEYKDTVIRYSDHWGSGIRHCNWYLKGMKNNNSFLFQKQNNYPGCVVGIIKLSDLINVEHLIEEI